MDAEPVLQRPWLGEIRVADPDRRRLVPDDAVVKQPPLERPAEDLPLLSGVRVEENETGRSVLVPAQEEKSLAAR